MHDLGQDKWVAGPTDHPSFAEFRQITASIQLWEQLIRQALKLERIEYHVTFPHVNRIDVEALPIVTGWTEFP